MQPSNTRATTTTPNTGRDSCAPGQGCYVQTLINSARRQENLIDLLADAVDAGDDKAIIEAATAIIANRRRNASAPSGK